MREETAGSNDPREDAARLSALLGSIHAVVWEGDLETWSCTYVSQGAERMLGYPIANWTTDPQFWLSVMGDHDRQAVIDEVARQAELGPDQEVEFRVRAADGRMVWVRNSTHLERDEQGQPVSLRGVMVDITQMKETQRRLQDSQDRLNSIFDSVSEGLVLFRKDGMIMDANPAAERILGTSAGKRSLRQDLPADMRAVDEAGSPLDFLDSPVPVTFTTGKPVRDYTMGIESPRGPRHWFQVNTGPIADADGQVQYVVMSLTDITARRAAEEERAMLSRAVGAANSAIGIASADGIMEYVNPAFALQVGHAPAELVGQHLSMLADPDAPQSQQETVWRAVNSGEAWRGELQNVRKDGTRIWISLSVAPVKDDEGNVKQLVFVTDDITRRRWLEGQLRQAQKLESVGRLAGGIAHDFNNLLTVIINYSSFVADKLEPGDPAGEDIREVLAAGRRASALTSQLLAFARQQVVEPSLVDVNDTVRQLNRMLLLLGPDIDLVTIPGPEIGMTWIDQGQLEQVIMNMAVNARDAMPGGGTLTIETSPVVRGAGAERCDLVQLAISDTGTGMPSDVAEQVFDPFFTTKEPGKGTGLGLATSYGIVSQAGGSISVASTPGKGTCFTVLLPVAASDCPLAPGPIPTATTPRGSETVLVVDDEPLVRALTTRLLTQAGYRVLTATGTDDGALSAATDERVDLLLTDIVMPRTNGRAVAQAFKSRHPNGRVLYMSGYADDSALRDEIASGEAEFLQKPFQAIDLATKVREVLDSA